MLNIPGLISIIIFYLLILGVGIFAALWKRRQGLKLNKENAILAGRDIGVFVGIFTMTATWVGGGYINGTAEVVYNPAYGLAWCQAPWGYALSLIIGGLFYAKPMRESKYITMIDVLQKVYGKIMGGFLALPAVLGELFWSAAILGALGSTIKVIMDIEYYLAIIVSAAVAIGYTLFGGMISVAYTDIVQLICIFIGLWISIPFAMTHPAARPLSTNGTVSWLGAVDKLDSAAFIDSGVMLILGGMPWQVYFQRVLSSKSAATAQILSFCAAFGCIIMAIPAILIGGIAATAEWSQTTYPGVFPFPPNETQLALPVVMQYMTPTAVSFIGLGAISAAVMSSADSSILSVSSMFSHNVVQIICWRNASETAITWFIRGVTLVMGIVASTIAIFVTTTYGLWYLSSDLVFCILFPQLTCALFTKWVNTYGSIVGFLLGIFFRLASGEPLLGLPPLIKWPGYYEAGPDSYQRFPFRIFAMLVNLIVLMSISGLMHYLFTRRKLSLKKDFLKCYVENKGDNSIERQLFTSSMETDEKEKSDEQYVNPHYVYSDENINKYYDDLARAY